MTPIDPQPLSCPEMVDLLTAYLEGALDEADQVSFDAHLGLCRGCRTYLDQFRETVTATGSLREDDVPPAVMTELLQSFRDWRVGRTGPRGL